MNELEAFLRLILLVIKNFCFLDSETLCDYNIVEGNKLHLFVREDAPSAPQQPPPDFFEQLQKFLEKHFTPNDAEKVLEEFRKVKLFYTLGIYLKDENILLLLKYIRISCNNVQFLELDFI